MEKPERSRARQVAHVWPAARSGTFAHAVRRWARWFTTPWGLVTLYVLALALRLVLAPHTGEHDDLGDYFRPWAVRLADVGPSHFYDGYIADPPAYLLFLWPLGLLARVLNQPAPSTLLLKMPSILADLGLAWVASEFALRVTPKSFARGPAIRAVVSAAVLFNPAVFWISSVWGQVDTLGTSLLLSSLLILFTGRRTFGRELIGMVLLGFAVAVKPQVALAIPAVGLALAWWHLRGQAEPKARAIELLRGAAAGATFFVGWGATGLPFGLGILETLHRYGGHTSINDFTGMWSYNLWGILGPWQHDVQGDSVLYIAGIPALYFGLLLFAVGITFVLRRSWRLLAAGESEGSVLLFTAAASSAIGFALLTRMWERYLLVTIVCLAPMIFRKRLWVPFAGLSAALMASEYYHYVFGAEFKGAPTFRIEAIYAWLLGGDPNGSWQSKVISLVVMCLLLWLAFRAWRSLHTDAPNSQRYSSASEAIHGRDAAR